MPHHEKNRCPWCDGQPDYKIYHDAEWGVPIYDDDKLFETLLLETFQAGLNCFTVLRKRENFRKAFDNFDAQKIARYDEKRIKTLCSDCGIIRNRLKIKASREHQVTLRYSDSLETYVCSKTANAFNLCLFFDPNDLMYRNMF